MYIKELYHSWRRMFWLLIVLMLAQLFFMFKGIENIPFFLYHMFSTTHEPQTSYPVIAIKVEGKYYDHSKLSNREYEMVIGSAERYLSLARLPEDPVNTGIRDRTARFGDDVTKYFIKQLSNDSLALNQYPAWWGKYFSAVSGIKGKEAAVVLLAVSYAPQFHRLGADSVLFTIKLPND